MTGKDEGGAQWDDPNQQVVRDDQSASWEEGTGGPPGDPSPKTVLQVVQDAADAEFSGAGEDLDAMTKDELLAYAQELGVSPANNAMSKAELRAGVDAKLAEGG